MPPNNSQPSKFILPSLFLLVASLPILVEAQCNTFFGGFAEVISVKESGQFLETNPPQTTTLNKAESGWASITIRENSLATYFSVTDNGDDFVFEVSFCCFSCYCFMFFLLLFYVFLVIVLFIF